LPPHFRFLLFAAKLVRATVEQDFHDVKEVWGTGQQQVRNIRTNVAVYHLNLWMHTLAELQSWNHPRGRLGRSLALPEL